MTTGVNCEQCIDGFYRPAGSVFEDKCLACNCSAAGSAGYCAKDSSRLLSQVRPLPFSKRRPLIGHW